MATARDNVRMTVPAIEMIAGIMEKKRRSSKNGPVVHRNHLEDLDPMLRAYVLKRCRRRGVPITSVLVVSENEAIIP